MTSFWLTKRIYSSYLILLKLVYLIATNLSQLFLNHEDLKESLKKKYIDDIGNLSPKVLKKDLEFRLNHLTTLLKSKLLWHSNNHFIMKELRKAVLLWSKFKNILNKDKTHFNWQKYKHQQNFGLDLLRKTKNNILQN